MNRPPVLEPIGPKAIDEGDAILFAVTAADPDAEALTYTAGNLPAGATFDPASGTFAWTPDFTQAGVFSGIHFAVSDGDLADSEEIAITVNNTNRPPVLDPIGVKRTRESTQIQFAVSAADPDGTTLTYSAANLPAGAVFDPRHPDVQLDAGLYPGRNVPAGSASRQATATCPIPWRLRSPSAMSRRSC